MVSIDCEDASVFIMIFQSLGTLISSRQWYLSVSSACWKAEFQSNLKFFSVNWLDGYTMPEKSL